jgi:murein DD-endopeptidase MepM/ murein hydrolase activator NlpD
MQIMWLSDPTGTVKVFELTTKKIITYASMTSIFFVLLGIGLHFVGFKLALDINPAILRALGGVTTQAEQSEHNFIYRNEMNQLQAKINTTVEDIHKLETIKNRLLASAIPVQLRDKFNHQNDSRGGPLVASYAQISTGALASDLDASIENVSKLNDALKNLHTQWQEQLNWVGKLPITLPLAQNDFHISSVFGIREDPFNEQLAMHEGVDFAIALGSPVVATAPGVVSRSGFDTAYGNVVEVTHIEGYVTRYAHMQKREVELGDKVERAQVLGRVGSTGRSTGPHLHYEVFYNGHVINPNQVILQSSSVL